MARVFGYARPSPSQSDTAILTRELADAGAEEIFVETTSARAPRSMRERRNLLRRIKADDTLVVVSLDRLGTTFDDVLRCFTILVDRGVNVSIINAGVETHGPCLQAYQALLGVLKYANSALHSETIKLRLAAARARGGAPAGMKPTLTDEMWPNIKRTIESTPLEVVASDLGVSRQTLWTYRRRMIAKEHPTSRAVFDQSAS